MRDLVAYHLAVVADAASINPTTVIASALTLIGVLGAAWLASRATRSRPTPPPAAEEPTVAPSPLAAFSGTQNEFMALVIADNELIRADVVALRTEVAGLRSELEAARSAHSAFERAVRRYLELLAGAWPAPHTMPWPLADDLEFLERTLPRRSRRSARGE